ncbi:hypothetical protein [Streptomyces sp. NPDC001903]|uniref:hypothetical protein n=1 Tax=Streptomyces sp. NPDC001903 TaxID=3364622 RepID=UPI0036BC2B90
MDEVPGENSLINKTARYSFDPGRPWPWVSYDDPAWPLEPWIAMNEEDLADAAVRFGIWYLRGGMEGMTTLRAAALFEDAVRRVVGDVVAEARTQRYSWGRIALCFRVGRTAVQKRFGRHPEPSRAQSLEDQYRWMSEYLYAADRDAQSAYPDRAEVAATRERCIRRRRGHVLDPLDGLHKVLPRKRRSSTGERGTAT